MSLFCVECGAPRTHETAKFCAKCGSAFGSGGSGGGTATTAASRHLDSKGEQLVHDGPSTSPPSAVAVVAEEVTEPVYATVVGQAEVVIKMQPSKHDPLVTPCPVFDGASDEVGGGGGGGARDNLGNNDNDAPTLQSTYFLCQNSALKLEGPGLGLPRLLRLQLCQSKVVIDARKLPFPRSGGGGLEVAEVRLEGCGPCCCACQSQVKVVVDKTIQTDFGGLSGCQNASKRRDDRSAASKAAEKKGHDAKAHADGHAPVTRVLRVTGRGCQSQVTEVLLDPNQTMPRGGLMGMLGF